MISDFDTETMRLIDANANRAREGIRTAEDYIRFTCGEGRWTVALKAVRAGITKSLKEQFSDEALVAHRLVATDPGRPDGAAGVQTGLEQAEPAKQVAQRGVKRAQEALRVLEEYLRARRPAASRTLSEYRYRLYEAEQWLVCASDRCAVVTNAPVYVLLTERLCRKSLLETAEAVLKAGVKLLQLREKDKPDQALLKQARDLQTLCADYSAVLFCNDRIDMALSAGAAGVHLGQEDLRPVEARRLTGERLLIGRSTHSVEQARRAIDEEQVDYIAIGSIYETSTKPERVLAGLSMARKVCCLECPTPVYAIGGITLERIEELKGAGVRHIAVSSAIIADPDPGSAASRFIEAMQT